jgi:lysophospholipase L1-like esterase
VPRLRRGHWRLTPNVGQQLGIMNNRIIVTYLVVLHILLGIVLLKSDFLQYAQDYIGISTPQSEYPRFFPQKLRAHSRRDSNVPKQAVIFIGDSHVQELDVASIVKPSVNYGIRGDTTVGVLQRIPIYRSLKNASTVVIAIGINDMGRRSNDEIIFNLQAIDAQIPKNVPVVISAVLPVDEESRENWQGINSRITKLNLEILDWIKISTNHYFVDVGPQLIDEKGNLADKFHINDGLHLNSRGGAIWVQQLKEAIHIAQQAAAPYGAQSAPPGEP